MIIIRSQGADSELARAIGRDWKGKASAVLILVGILSAFFIHSWAACVIYALVAGIWLIPDSRIERATV